MDHKFYKSNKNKIFLLFVLFIFILGFFLRYHNIEKHQSQNDEWLAAWHIVEVKNRNFENFYSSKIKKLNTTIDSKNGIKKIIYYNFKNDEKFLKKILKINDFIMLPGGSTIAPMMFYISYFLINKNEKNYEEIIGKLRSISLLFYSLSFFLIFLIFKKNNFFNSKISFFIFLIIFYFSNEHILFSRQYFNYSYTIIIIPLILINLKIKNIYLCNLITLFCILVSYQTFFILPAYFIAKFYIFFKARISIKNLIYEFLFTSLIVIIFFYLFIKSEGLGSGINWNSGFDNEFLFSQNKAKDDYIYFFIFYLVNLFKTIGSTTSFFEINNIFYKIQNSFFFIFFILGFFQLIQKNSFKFEYKIFVIITLITLFILIFFQKITLSPTRHFIFYLPIFTFLIFVFFKNILENINQNTKYIIFFIIFLIINFLSFSNYYNLKKRYGIFVEEKFEKILKKNKVGKIFILNNCTGPIYFSKYINKNYELYHGKHSSCEKIKKNKTISYNKNIILIDFTKKIILKDLYRYAINYDEYKLVEDNYKKTFLKSELYQNIDAYLDQYHYQIYKKN